MKSDKVRLNNPDGSTTEIKVVSGTEQHAVAVVMPAMGVFAKYYQPLAETMANTGFAVVLDSLSHLRSHEVSRSNCALINGVFKNLSHSKLSFRYLERAHCKLNFKK